MAFTTNKPTNWGLFVAACFGLLAAMWYLSSAINDVTNFMDWDKGKEYATLMKAGGLFIAAFLIASGVDLRALFGQLATLIPGTTTTITESVVKTTEAKVEDNTAKKDG